MPRCRHSWLVAVGVLATAGVTAAEGPTKAMAPAAKAELDRGLERFKAKDYAAAIVAFDAGYAIDPKPEFLYVKAQAQRLGGDCRTAIATYRAYLATHPPQDKVEYATANIDRCEKQIASEPSAPVQPEPAASEPSPPAPPLPSPPVVASDTRMRSRWSDRTAWAIAGGGAVAIGVGAAFALLARGAADDATNAEDIFEWEAAHDAWARDRRVAEVATVVGLGLGVVAAVRFATAPAAGARFAVSHGGAMVLMEGRW